MAEQQVRGSIDDLFTELASSSQRLVKIFIGDSEAPIQLQQSALESTSKYFTSAFRENRFEEAKSGILRLPEDNIESWKVLAYWIIHREVPETMLKEDLLLSIRCWITGDKYDIKEFQDAVMICMLMKLDPSYESRIEDVLIKLDPSYERRIEDVRLSVEMIQTAFNQTTGLSPLRRMVVERKVYEYNELEPIDYNDSSAELEALDGIGFLPCFINEKEAFWNDRHHNFAYCDQELESYLGWKRYMVGSVQSKRLPLPDRT